MHERNFKCHIKVYICIQYGAQTLSAAVMISHAGFSNVQPQRKQKRTLVMRRWFPRAVDLTHATKAIIKGSRHRML